MFASTSRHLYHTKYVTPINRMLSKYMNRTAVITGAGSGFGAAFAKKAASEGMNLVLADIAYDKLVSIGESLNIDKSRIKYIKCDVSKEQDIKQLADTAFDQFSK